MSNIDLEAHMLMNKRGIELLKGTNDESLKVNISKILRKHVEEIYNLMCNMEANEKTIVLKRFEEHLRNFRIKDNTEQS